MRIVLSMTLAVVSAVSAPLYKAELIIDINMADHIAFESCFAGDGADDLSRAYFGFAAYINE